MIDVIVHKIICSLFPQDSDIKKLESLSPSEINSKCKKNNRAHKDFYGLFSYKDHSVRQIVWQIKYRRNPVLVDKMADILSDAVLSEIEEGLMLSGDYLPALVTGVPMPKLRERERGWNQSEVLAKAVAEKAGGKWLIYKPVLKRVKDTCPQTNLSRKERLENMKEAFGVKFERVVRGETIVLIDDVATTGSTLSEARKVLRNAGAKKVMAFTVAH